MEHRIWERLLLWLVFYAAAQAVSFAAMGLLSLLIPLTTWKQVSVGIWLQVCFSSLCFPDNIWDRWIPKEK